MARKFIRKKKYGKKKRVYKKPLRYKVADMAYSAFRGVRYLKGLVNAELHSADFSATGTAIPSSGSIVPFTAIAQGDNYNNRQGNSILAKYLFGRMEFVKNGSSNYTFIRVIFFRDTQQIGDTDPAVTDVLSSANTLSPLNQFQKGRFTIMKDMRVRLDTNKITSSYKIKIKLPFHIRYNGTTGGDLQKNGVYMLVIGSEPTNTPLYSYNFRISFYDN